MKFTAAKSAPVGECAKHSRRLPCWMPGPMVLGCVGAAMVPTSSHCVSGGTAGICWLPGGSPQTLALGSLRAGALAVGGRSAWWLSVPVESLPPVLRSRASPSSRRPAMKAAARMKPRWAHGLLWWSLEGTSAMIAAACVVLVGWGRGLDEGSDEGGGGADDDAAGG